MVSLVGGRCSIVLGEGRRGTRNSCATCLFRRKLSGVLGGINRRYARAIVTTGGGGGARAICRVASLLCRILIVVTRRNVAPRSVRTRLTGETRGHNGLGGFRRISGGSWRRRFVTFGG